MSVVLARRVLWCFLALLLPLPVFYQGEALIPLARQLYLLAAGVGDQVFAGQVLVWCLVCVGLSWLYGRIAAAWPARLRGSAIGLLALAMLIVFSSFPVYRPVVPQQEEWVEFRQLYVRIEN